MMRRLIVPVLILLCSMAAFAAWAQGEATPEAPVTVTGDNPIITNDSPDVTVTGEGPTIVNTDNPDILQPLLALAGSVFSLLQILKNGGLSDWVKSMTSNDKHQELIYLIIGSVLAFLIMAVTESNLDALAIVLNLKPPTSDIAKIARMIVTAILAGGGQAAIHLLYDALWKLARVQRVQ